MSCLTRRDVITRLITNDDDTMEIGIYAANPVGFMHNMLGTNSDWATGLGTNFEQSLETKYSLNTRSRRAW